MSSMRALPALALAAATLAACAGGPGAPLPTRTPPGPVEFRPSDFAWSQAPGRNRIDGRLVYRQGPARFTCSGSGVVLTPETPWTRRRMSILYASAQAAALPADEVRARTPSAPNADYSGFVRTTTCDADSRFAFSGLPDGAWFVIAMARPTSGQGPSMAIMRRVVTRGGRAVALDL